jgi:hypothetical protein
MQLLEDLKEFCGLLYLEPVTVIAHEYLDFFAVGCPRVVKQMGGHGAFYDTRSNSSRVVFYQEALIDWAL